MAKHLILNLESPLMSFGGETIDNLGVIRPFPAVSMLTGLLANALGWRRVERQRHQDLQDRIVFAARIDREPHGGLRLTDFQTRPAQQYGHRAGPPGDAGRRAGGANTYNAPHLRYRDYHADMRVTVALRLDPADGDPALDAVGGEAGGTGPAPVHRTQAVPALAPASLRKLRVRGGRNIAGRPAGRALAEDGLSSPTNHPGPVLGERGWPAHGRRSQPPR